MHTTVGTVCFFIREDEVLLFQIQQPTGELHWNGIGGVVDPGETTTQALVREISEETKLKVDEQDVIESKVVTIDRLDLHVFITKKWGGRLEIIDPTIKQFKWFKFSDVPYSKMHKGNDDWLPEVLDSARL